MSTVEGAVVARETALARLAERHLADVAEVREVLDRLGVAVDDALPVATPTGDGSGYLADLTTRRRPAPLLTRLTVPSTDARAVGVGYLVVATRDGDRATVEGTSLFTLDLSGSVALLDERVRRARSSLPRDLPLGYPSGFVAATNPEVARVHELRGSLDPAVSHALSSSVPVDLGDGAVEAVFRPEHERRSGVLAATRLLVDLVDGASLEWALRRLASAS